MNHTPEDVSPEDVSPEDVSPEDVSPGNLRQEELSPAEPGPTDVVVVGAGLVGVSLAAALVERGAEVTLVEAHQPGAGTTGTSYAWINSHKKHPLPYHRINEQGVAAWRRIAVTDPDAVTFAGHLEVAVDPAHRATLTERVQRLRSLGYPADWLTPAQARQRTVLDVPPDALVAVFEGEGHAFPERRLVSLLDQLDRSGRCTRVTATASSIEVGEPGSADGRRVMVHTDQGPLPASRVVVAAGNGSSALVAAAGGRLPLVPATVDGPAFGYLADADAPGHGITGLLTTDTLSLRPAGADTLLLQALDTDGDADPAIPPGARVAATFAARLAALLPDVPTRVTGVRVGHRVIPADGQTVAGPLGPGSPVFAVVTHSGVVLAPWLAEVVAEEVLGGSPEPMLADFRPDRFHRTESAPAVSAPRSPGDQ